MAGESLVFAMAICYTVNGWAIMGYVVGYLMAERLIKKPGLVRADEIRWLPG
jgi:hypothetical protein